MTDQEALQFELKMADAQVKVLMGEIADLKHRIDQSDPEWKDWEQMEHWELKWEPDRLLKASIHLMEGVYYWSVDELPDKPFTFPARKGGRSAERRTALREANAAIAEMRRELAKKKGGGA